MMDWSWTELQALGVRAASGAQVPPAQALAFGAMLARHLADGGNEAPVTDALAAPGSIRAMAQTVEDLVEAASVTAKPVATSEQDAGRRALLISWLRGLPCQTEVSVMGDNVRADLTLSEPSTRSRPAHIAVSADFASHLNDLADRAHVPKGINAHQGGAGAGLMGLD
ncbi:hypothetical protein [uncultured Tateyamaria sp.]|uniref:hypothetical protein n=1 Tax=uncultured Tateyamaria sp. TaxID=455651 RepID=UPI0026113FE7|nr:hypothetical protein [uncultured Tateyamaria sp.]